MAHLGDFDASTVVYGKFTTYRPSTGAAYTLGGTPALSVYKDNATAQSTTGVTLTADFDAVAGLNHFAIDTSADGTFYAAGSFFDIVITTGTVDSVSVVGAVVGSFTLRKTSALKPTTAARTLDVSAGGEAGLDWANVGSPTTAVNLSATNIDVDQVVASVSGAVGSVTGLTASDVGAIKTKTDFLPSATAGNAGGVFIAGTNAATTITTALTTTFTGNLTGSVGSVTGAVGSVTGAVGSVTGAVGSVTGNVGGNVTGSVGSIATGGIAATSFAAGAIDAAAIAANAIGASELAADAVTEIQSGLATAAALTTAAGEVTAIKAKTDSLTFTTAGQVDANIQSVNDVALQGTGAVGTDEWRAV